MSREPYRLAPHQTTQRPGIETEHLTRLADELGGEAILAKAPPDYSSALRDLLRDGLLDSNDVARVLGTTPRSVGRWQRGTQPRPAHRQRLLELDAVVELARAVLPGAAARVWLRAPVPALNDEAPLDLLSRGEWTTIVNVLLAAAEGVTA